MILSNTTQTTINFVKLLKVKISKSDILHFIENHPDSDTLLSINDALNNWKIKTAAFRCTIEELENIPIPFIVQIKLDSETMFTTVSGFYNEKIRLFINSKHKYEEIPIDDFKKTWTGIVLIAETQKESGDTLYTKHQMQNIARSCFPVILTIGTIIICINASTGHFKTTDNLILLFTSLIGLLASTILLWHEVDNNNPMINRMCSAMPNGSCDLVLSSKAAKIFSWLSWSDVGFSYFAGCVIYTCLLFPIFIIYFCSILAFPYIIFSLVYQFFIIKRWCILCLIVQCCLLFQLILGCVNIAQISLITLYDIFILISTIIFSFSLVFTIKPIIMKYFKLTDKIKLYNQFKYNTNNFHAMQQLQNKLLQPVPQGVDLINCDANHQIVIICNPYCGACSRMHHRIHALIPKLSNTNVKIIFTTPGDISHHSYDIVRFFIELASQSKQYIIDAIEYWYMNNSDKDCLNQLMKKYNTHNLMPDDIVNSIMDDMYVWCNDANITGTPTLFFDGYEIPDIYDVEELVYFSQD